MCTHAQDGLLLTSSMSGRCTGCAAVAAWAGAALAILLLLSPGTCAPCGFAAAVSARHPVAAGLQPLSQRSRIHQKRQQQRRRCRCCESPSCFVLYLSAPASGLATAQPASDEAQADEAQAEPCPGGANYTAADCPNGSCYAGEPNGCGSRSVRVRAPRVRVKDSCVS